MYKNKKPKSNLNKMENARWNVSSTTTNVQGPFVEEPIITGPLVDDFVAIGPFVSGFIRVDKSPNDEGGNVDEYD